MAFLVLGCAANSGADIVPYLVARRPVCLSLDWGQEPRATSYARLAPDTLLLLPGQKERHGLAAKAEVWGNAALAPSQQDREGGGWVWWMAGDTLRMETHTPTMEYLAAWAVHPKGNVLASWAGGGLGPTAQGHVVLRPYKCKELLEAP